MTAPVPITFTGHTSEDLHRFARECKGVRQALQVHAIAMLLDEASRS
ncbi:MAG: hypothetical protein OXC68_11510 [Aestuariivita sp.]|nr:hypothetical protein [Aestuariivita sp.]